MEIKYVLFDCWDTVLRFGLKEPDGNFKAIYSHITDKSDYPLEQFILDFHAFLGEYYQSTTYESSIEAIIAYMVEAKGKKLDCSYRQAAKDSIEAYASPLMEGLKDVTAFLSKHGLKCSVLSNTIHSNAQTSHLISKAWPDHPFEHIIASSTYGVKKPDSRFFLLGAEKVGVVPGNIIYIGDNLNTDMRGAFQAGMHPFWFNWKLKQYSADEIRDLPLVEFHSYQELIDILEKDKEKYGIR
jgi:FMN phosphatase YigB (HAD superfamily)